MGSAALNIKQKKKIKKELDLLSGSSLLYFKQDTGLQTYLISATLSLLETL